LNHEGGSSVAMVVDDGHRRQRRWAQKAGEW
jgi:hypothetical protein